MHPTGNKNKDQIRTKAQIVQIFVANLKEHTKPQLVFDLASDECLTTDRPRSRERHWINRLCTDTRKRCGKQQLGHIWGVYFLAHPYISAFLAWNSVTQSMCLYSVGQVWPRPDAKGVHVLPFDYPSSLTLSRVAS